MLTGKILQRLVTYLFMVVDHVVAFPRQPSVTLTTQGRSTPVLKEDCHVAQVRILDACMRDFLRQWTVFTDPESTDAQRELTLQSLCT